MGLIVFTNGCFDVFTAVHYKILLRCRQLAGKGGKVIVGLDTDEKIRKDKGEYRPIFSYSERANVLGSETIDNEYGRGEWLVDLICPFNTNEELKQLIIKHKPHVLIKGYDWLGKGIVGSDIVPVVDIMPKYDYNHSTTEIEERILKKHSK
jgi:D-beta-D-heptose 7-phosphate kinase/D-beta-D-heptose 1-phosphate adenosyltransferase